jgi:hypothetical protein
MPCTRERSRAGADVAESRIAVTQTAGDLRNDTERRRGKTFAATEWHGKRECGAVLLFHAKLDGVRVRIIGHDGEVPLNGAQKPLRVTRFKYAADLFRGKCRVIDLNLQT